MIRCSFIFALVIIGSSLTASAQDYADIGAGIHREKITWLKWNDPSLADGIHNGDTASFTLPTGEIIDVTFSNVIFTPAIPGSGNYLPADMMPPWATGTNARALHPNYDFAGSNDNGMLYSGAPGSNQNGQNISFDISFAASRNGASYVPDLIFADPESTNPVFLENITVSTNGDNWVNIEDLQGTSYTVGGFGTTTISITDTESPQHAPLMLSKASTTLSVSIAFPNGDGHAGVAFGILSPYDLSDAPASYGDAAHFQIFEASAGPDMINNSTLYLGSTVPDVETIGDSPDGLGDDGTGLDDDDGVTFPVMVPGKMATVNVTVNGSGGYLQGWIDFDASGTFTASDRIATDVQDGGVNDADGIVNGSIRLLVSVPWTASSGNTYSRFRWSTTSGLDATTTASDGEVEDHGLTISSCATGADTDNDGVADICDLDDDNDGILDSLENTVTLNSTQPACNSLVLDFSAIPTLVSGTALTQGAVYKYNAVASGIDAKVTIIATENASVASFDDNSSDASYFRPQTGVSSLDPGVDAYVEYLFEFVTGAGEVPVEIDELFVNFNDVDGNVSYGEENWIQAPTSYTIENPTDLELTMEKEWVRIISNTVELTGATNAVPAVNLSARFLKSDSLVIRVGVESREIGASASARAHSVQFSCVSNFVDPTTVYLDVDEDGLSNALDLDSDNDGIFDVWEAGHGGAQSNGILNGPIDIYGIPVAVSNASGSVNFSLVNTDGVDVADAYDLDSDNDSCFDVKEAGFKDQNGDGILGPLPLTTNPANGLVTSGGN